MTRYHQDARASVGDQGDGHVNSVVTGFQGPWSLAGNLAQSRKTDTSNDPCERQLDRAEDLKRNHVDAEQRYVDKASKQQAITIGCEKAENRRDEYPFAKMENVAKRSGIPLPAVGRA